MENFGPLSLLITGIVSILCVVGSVAAAWRLGSRSTPSRKPPRSPPPMSDFEVRFAKVDADLVELFSTLQKLTKSMQRLSSRAGMEDLRERRANAAPPDPPVGTPKAELRKHYGLNGLSPQQIAQRQMFTDRSQE